MPLKRFQADVDCHDDESDQDSSDEDNTGSGHAATSSSISEHGIGESSRPSTSTVRCTGSVGLRSEEHQKSNDHERENEEIRRAITSRLQQSAIKNLVSKILDIVKKTQQTMHHMIAAQANMQRQIDGMQAQMSKDRDLMNLILETLNKTQSLDEHRVRGQNVEPTERNENRAHSQHGQRAPERQETPSFHQCWAC